VSFRPPKRFRAELVGLLEMLRAERNVLRRMIVGMVRETKRDRVHLQGNRELIQRAFERVSPRTFAWGAHESWRRNIHGINRLLDPDRRTLVHQPGRTRAGPFRELPDWRV